MSVSDGQPVNAAITNAAFVSRTTDSNTTAKIDLEDPAAESGTSVTNVQRELNGQDSFVTDSATVNTTKDRKPTWSSDTLGTPNQAVKERVDSVQAQVETNQSDISTISTTKVDKVNPATDTAVPRFSGTTGDLQDSGVLIDASDNVTIPGDLTVSGTTTTINTSTMDVEDANITVNSGGDQATADSNDAGLTVEMSDATNAVIGYDSTLTSKFQVGEVGSEAEIATTSGQQALTNKDYDGGTASNTSRITFPQDTKANLDGLTRKEGTVVYASDEDKLYYDDGTTLIEVGSGAGSGSGRVNFLDVNDATLEGGLGNWVDYDDTGAFVDGTGGTPTVISALLDTDGRVVGDNSLEIAKSSADGAGQGVSVVSQIIDPAYRGRKIIVEFEFNFTDPQYPSNDVKLYAYDVTNSAILPIVGDRTIPNTKGKFQCQILPEDTTQEVRLAFHLDTDNAIGQQWDVHVDQILLTVDQTAPANISNHQSENVTSFTGVTYSSGVSNLQSADINVRRLNGSYVIGFALVFDMTDVTANFATMTVPLSNFTLLDGKTITKVSGAFGTNVNSTTNGRNFSNGYVDSSGTFDGFLFRFTGDFQTATNRVASGVINLYVEDDDNAALISTTESLVSTSLVSASGNAGEVLTANVTDIPFIEVEDSLGLWDGDTFTAPKTGFYSFEGMIRVTVTGGMSVRAYVNGSADIRVSSNDDTVVKKFSGKVKLDAGDELTFRIDLGKTLNNIAEDHYIVINSEQDFSTFSVYGESQLVEANAVSQAYGFTAGQYGDLTSIELTPGEWDLYANVTWNATGAITATELNVGISTSSGNAFADQVAGKNFLQNDPPRITGNLDNETHNLTVRGVVVTEPTTYYLKARAVTSSANMDTHYYISARKIK